MSKTSRPPSFAAALNEKTAQDQEALRNHRQQIEDTAKGQQRELGETLTRNAEHELTRTASAIQRHAGRTIGRALGALWLRTLVITIGVCMGTWSSVWVIGQWQHRQIKENIDMLILIDQQIEERRQTLRELN